MAKKSKPQVTEPKPLTPAEVAVAKVEDQAANMQAILGFGLASAYNLGLAGGATVATKVAKDSNYANVDGLPEQKK